MASRRLAVLAVTACVALIAGCGGDEEPVPTVPGLADVPQTETGLAVPTTPTAPRRRAIRPRKRTAAPSSRTVPPRTAVPRLSRRQRVRIKSCLERAARKLSRNRKGNPIEASGKCLREHGGSQLTPPPTQTVDRRPGGAQADYFECVTEAAGLSEEKRAAAVEACQEQLAD